MGHTELRPTRKLVRAPAVPERAAQGDERQPPESSLTAAVLQLQRAAGNRAVTSALAAAPSATSPEFPFAIQRAPADSAGNASAGTQLGAVWDKQVVLPLARAAERLGRDKPDLEGARPELETARGTIAMLRAATPAEDSNHVRLEIVERRARGPLDLIDRRLGRSSKGRPLENGMIEVRAEAASLGPLLEHMPDQDTLIQKGAVRSPASAAQAQGPASGPVAAAPASPASPEPGNAPVEAADSATTATADGGAVAGGPSIAEVWKVLVVDRFWSGQKAMEETPYLGYFDWTVAISRITEFYEAAPPGHPTRFPLLKLFTDAMQVHDLMGELDREFAGDPLADRAEEAYGTAVEMGEILSGQPSTDTEGPEGGEPGEPDFTWERERPPMKNDTDLERP
ncbi:MAG: hypothetical protein ACAH65_12825 [Chloroflexota bacterium]